MAYLHSPPKLLPSPQRDSSEPAYGVGPIAHDAVDLREIWAILRRRRFAVFGIAGLVFAGVIGATLASHMDFRASSRLYLGELSEQSKPASNPEDQMDLLGPQGGDVGSEVEILKSRSLVTRAVLASGLNVQIAPSGANEIRYWQWLFSRRDPNLLERNEHDILAADATLTNDTLGVRKFRVVFRDNRQYEVLLGQRSLGQGELGQDFKSSEVNLRLLEGGHGVPKRGTEYNMAVTPLNEVVDSVLESLEVTAAKTPVGAEPVKVIGLGFAARTPRLATTFLEQLMAGYLEERKSWKTEDARAAGDFVTSQLSGMRETLDQIEQKLADYRTKNRVVVLDNEAKAMIEQVGKYEEQRVAARLEVAALAGVNRALKDPSVPVEAFMVGEAKDTVLEGMAASLAKSRQALADLETKFNGPAPNLREQRQQVEAQQAAIKSYVAGRLQRAQQNLGTLNGVIGQFEQRLRTVPGAELGLTQLERESEVYSNLYSYLLKRQQQAAMIKASTVSKNRVLDVPEAPNREDSPKLLLRLASAPLGLLVGALGVVLAGLWGITFQSESELRRVVGATPVLGRLTTRRRMQKRKSVTLTNFDFPDEDRDPEWIEACRTLRANLYRICEHSERPVVLVTSPAEGDGKTACVLSLAELVAADGKAVLVIEADIRKPRAEDDDQAERAPDLLDVLQGFSRWREAVRLVPSPLGEFHVLQAADTARPELLSGKAMRDLLREVRTQYDLVLLDVPSYPATSDALVLSAYAQCVLSVVRLRRTPRRVTLQHLRELTRNIPHGIVVNDVEGTALGYSKRAASNKSAPNHRQNRLAQVAAEYLVVSPESGAAGSSR